MISTLRSHLTYANVMATVAVFIALSGSAYAATAITGKNVKNGSLTGSDVKNSSLTGSDVKNSSLTTSDVKDKSLLAKDFKAGQLPAGARGAQGPQGTPGAAGATNVVTRTATTSIPANTLGGLQAAARCDAGQRAVAGGFFQGNPQPGDRIVNSIPITATTDSVNPPGVGATPTGWGVLLASTAMAPARTFTAYAVCASP